MKKVESILTYTIQIGLGGLAAISFIGLAFNLLTQGVGDVSFGIYG